MEEEVKKQVKRRGKKPKSIIDKFSSFTTEEIYSALNRLREDQRKLIIKAYGENLDNPTLRDSLTLEERKKIDSIVHNNFYRLLKNPNKESRQIKTVYDYFVGHSKEEVLEGFSKLSESTKERIIRAYGENLDDISKRKNISSDELKRIHSLIDTTLRIKINEISSPLAKNIFEYFEGYSKEQILKAFYTLTPSQQDLLKRAYGENLDDASKRLKLTPQERAKANDIIRSTFKNRVSKNITTKRGVKNIFDRFSQYSTDEVLEAFSRLALDQQKILIKAYGEKLDSHILYSTLSETEKKRVNGIVCHELHLRLFKKKMVSTSIKNVFELYENYTEIEVLDAISRLKEEEQFLLREAFGSDYLNPNLRFNLDKKDRIRLNSILHSSLVRRLENPNLKAQIIYNIFSEYPNYSKEDILLAFNKLNDNQKNLLYKAFGPNLDDDSKVILLTAKERQSLKRIINISLKNKLTPRKKSRKVKNIFERYPNYSKEEILEAFSRLTKEEQDLLYSAYGSDLTSNLLFSKLPEDIKAKVKNIVSFSINNRLLNPSLNGKRKKGNFISLEKYFKDYSFEDIIYVISTLSNNEQLFLKEIYGPDYKLECNYKELAQEAKNKIDYILREKMKLRLANIQKEQDKLLFDYFDKIDKFIILKAINLLNAENKYYLNKVYGISFKDKPNKELFDINRINNIISLINENIELLKETDSKEVINSIEREKSNIKKSKLSYYYSLRKDLRKLYLDYYFEEVPRFKKIYEQSSKKEELLETEIQKSTLLKEKYLERKRYLIKKLLHKNKSQVSIDVALDEIYPALDKALFDYNVNEEITFDDFLVPYIEREIKSLERELKRSNQELDTTKKQVRNNISLLEYFNDFSKDKVLEAISYFSENDQNLLKKAYGDDLSSTYFFKTLEEKEKKRIYFLRSKVKDFLQGKITLTPGLSLTRKDPKVKPKTLIEIFNNYSINELIQAINLLNEKDQQLLKRTYGEDYSSYSGYYTLTKSEKQKVYKLKVQLKSYLEGEISKEKLSSNRSRNVSLMEYYKDYGETKVLEIINKLQAEDIILLQKVYGPNYNQKANYEGIDNSTRNRVYTIKRKIKLCLEEKIPLEGNITIKKLKQPTTLKDYFKNYQVSELKAVISLLREDEQVLIYKAYGNNLDSIEEYSNTNSSDYQKLVNVRKLLKQYFKGEITKEELLERNNYKKIHSLKDTFSSFSEEQLLEKIKLLSSKDYNLLVKAYGENFDTTDNFDNLDDREKKRLYVVRGLLKDYLTGKKTRTPITKQPTSLYDYFKSYQDRLIEGVSLLNPKEQELLIKAYGNEFKEIKGFSELSETEKKQISYLKKLLNDYFKGIITKEKLQNREVVVRNISILEYFNNYDQSKVLEAITYLSEDDIKVLIEAYGEEFDNSNNYKNLLRSKKNKIYKIRRLIGNYLEGKITKEELRDKSSNPKAIPLLDCFKSHNKELIINTINTLNEEDKTLLQKAYGNDYSDTSNYNNLTIEEKKRINKIKEKIKKRLTKKLTPTTIEKKQPTIKRVTPKRQPNSLLELLKEYPKEKIIKAIDSLLITEVVLLKKAYGEDFSTATGYSKLTKQEKQKVASIRVKLKKIINNNRNHKTPSKRISLLSNEATFNPLFNLEYKKLTREEEIIFIKKLKLSYYYDVDDDLKRRYLDYYFEVFPIKRNRYQKIVNDLNLVKNEITELLNYSTHFENGLEYQKRKYLDYLELLSNKLKKIERKRKRLLDIYIEDSKEYRDRFLENNQRLVTSIAKRNFGADFLDLQSEGNIGLMRALEKFDLDKETKFSTYATWWIKQSISRYLDENTSGMHVPVHMKEKVRKVNAIYQKLFQDLHREPTEEELSLETGLSIEQIKQVQEVMIKEPTSLDQTIKYDSDTDLSNLVGEEDFNYDAVESSLFLEQFREYASKVGLSEREKLVVTKRLGLDDNIIKTLDDIGFELGITRERVRQIESVAFAKLRSSISGRDFFGYQKEQPKQLTYL